MTVHEISHNNGTAQPAAEQTFFADLANGLFDGAIQNPYNGIAESTGLPELGVIDNSKKEGIVKQFGISAGTVLPFFLTRGALRSTCGACGFQTRGIIGAATEAGASGAVMGLTLTPVDTRTNLWDNKLRAAGVNAATFFTLGLAGSALGSTSALASDVGLRSLPTNVARNGLAGLPGGFVYFEASSYSAKKKFDLNPTEVGKSVLNYMAFEGLLGALDSIPTAGPKGGSVDDIAQRFPKYTEAQLSAGRKAVLQEMSVVRASTEGGHTMSVLDKFNDCNLSPAQKERVLDSLAAVRENYTRHRDGSNMDSDQEKFWIHTQGELGRVLDSAKLMKLTPEQTEDALLASMFSDSVKTKSNFTVHHIDGAKAAHDYLGNYFDEDFTPVRLHGITEAIKEHQIGPPGFMSMIYTGRIRSALLRERETAAGTANGAGVKPTVSADEQATISEIGRKLAHPFSVPLTESGEGGLTEIFTAEETALLRRAGIDKWYIPSPHTSWYEASRAVINGDSIDNYATAGGFSKIVGLNGPESDIYFKDKTIDVSLASPRKSFEQAYEVMTPEGRQLANAELSNTDAAILRARARVGSWLRQQTETAPDEQLPNIPYWNSDLAYPLRPTEEMELDWWNIHRIDPIERTFEQEQFYNTHRYDGLTEPQIKEFQFAKQIRDKLVDELRREQRLDGQLPPDFKPEMQ